jgi:hypothetical protein
MNCALPPENRRRNPASRDGSAPGCFSETQSAWTTAGIQNRMQSTTLIIVSFVDLVLRKTASGGMNNDRTIRTTLFKRGQIGAVKLKLWPFLAARTAIGTRASARFSVNLQGDVEAA